MNHYPRHIGDIARDTFGLSPTEFGCYDRLLDSYYATECPLPIDRREHYRTANCRSAADRKACDYIVNRYFTQEADGWHQKRCDEELAKFAEDRGEELAKREHEHERQQRHRERRRDLFATLRQRNIVPPWDTPITELERLCNAPETDLARVTGRSCNAPVTRQTTANQNHNHNHKGESRENSTQPRAREEPAAPPRKGLNRHDDAQARAATARGIFPEQGRTDEPTDITAEAKRIA